MSDFLIDKFVKNKTREEYGKFAGLIGVLTNLLLTVIKIILGIFSRSIAIIADGFNNLSDSLTSVITIIAFKLSSKPADEEHPYGHARYEYISGFLVAIVVFLIGVQFLITSFKKIIRPEPTIFSNIGLIVLILSIAIKIWQSLMYKKIGKKIDSQMLIANSIDSRNDVVTTFAAIFSILFEYLSGIKIDGIIGTLTSIFIILSALDLLKETLNPLIGIAPKKEYLSKIKKEIRDYPDVIDCHDLIIHNYGPDNQYATVHVEMSSDLELLECHETIDTIERDFLEDKNINLVIHLDPVVENDPEAYDIKNKIEKITEYIDEGMSIHDFRILRKKDGKKIVFDLNIPENIKIKNSELKNIYTQKLLDMGIKYELVIIMDRQYMASI